MANTTTITKLSNGNILVDANSNEFTIDSAYLVHKDITADTIFINDKDGSNKHQFKVVDVLEVIHDDGHIVPIADINTLFNELINNFFMPQIPIGDPNLNISMGRVKGQSTLIKWGQNRDVDTADVPEDITDIGSVYVPPTENRIHQFVSDSIEDKGSVLENSTITTASTTAIIDTAALFITNGVSIGDTVLLDTTQDHTVVTAIVSETELTVKPLHHERKGTVVGNSYRVVTPIGTGSPIAHILLGNKEDDEIFYTEFIVLNGTTNVPTLNSYFRITRVHTHGSGSNKKNVGNITATADVDATVTAKVLAGNGQTEMAFFYVPKNHTLYLDGWETTLSRDGVASDVMARMELRSQLWGTDGEILEYGQGISIGTAPPIVWKKPKKITQETDLWARCVSVSDNNTYVHSGFYGVLVKND